jgi:hypothetical protein
MQDKHTVDVASHLQANRTLVAPGVPDPPPHHA